MDKQMNNQELQNLPITVASTENQTANLTYESCLNLISSA